MVVARDHVLRAQVHEREELHAGDGLEVLRISAGNAVRAGGGDTREQGDGEREPPRDAAYERSGKHQNSP